jgi:hypothetical protein
MQKIVTILFLSVCLPAIAFSQLSLSGKVTDGVNHQPLAGVSVYLSNTSIGGITNENGEFILRHIPSGKYDLVVSGIGYETYSTTISSGNLQNLSIELKPKEKQLDDVVVSSRTSHNKSSPKEYHTLFFDKFIGTSSNAADCKIVNEDAVKFRYNESRKILTASAGEPLIIENKALGYTIRFDLKVFSYDYYTGYVFYSGYPYFTAMSAKNIRRQKVWEKRREEVYEGSVMHFMRALFQNKLPENKFEVKKAKEENGKDSTYPQLLSGASITHTMDSVTLALEFPDQLEITYKGHLAPDEFLNARIGQLDSRYSISTIQLIDAKNVKVAPNGSYFNPLNLLENGYWAWSEKVCNMLPFDYKPTFNQ